jgi:hypothetical protein
MTNPDSNTGLEAWTTPSLEDLGDASAVQVNPGSTGDLATPGSNNSWYHFAGRRSWDRRLQLTIFDGFPILWMAIWDAIDGRQSTRDIVTQLTARFDVSAEQCAAEVDSYMASMANTGIVRAAGGSILQACPVICHGPRGKVKSLILRPSIEDE